MLIKNCLKTNKILWASQFAMQAIVYLISTDLERVSEKIIVLHFEKYIDKIPVKLTFFLSFKPINIVNGHNGDPV